MKLKVDKESNALYFRFDENAIVESEEVRPGVILDFDKNGMVVGVEFLDIAERVGPEALTTLQFQSV
jgi:uncharacterized protein YuzE